jgi:hypothetical protein
VSERPTKVVVHGDLVKLLFHQRTDRGMRLIEEQSRCVRVGEVHELVTTDQAGLGPGSRVDRVGFLGFAEIGVAGVVDVGDIVLAGSLPVGVVAGFDQCHFPNHYNILVHSPVLHTATDLGLVVGQRMWFHPAEGAEGRSW